MMKKIRIKLISPKMSLRPMDSEFKRRMSPSLSLVALATLTPEPHEVLIEDENLNAINYNDLPDLVGITVNVDTSYRAIEIARQYRSRGVKVVFGGIHASAAPESFFDHCDSVCIGEAEEIWPRIIEDFIADNLRKTYFNPVPTDLKQMPISDWKYVSKNDYLYHNIIVASRGCPFQCEFCYNSCDYAHNSYRNRPIPDVIAEIERMKTKQVMFIDDNLIGNIRWINEFVEAITPMKLTWHAAVSANIYHSPALIEKMANSGCRSLFIGFESINPESIKCANKGQNKIEEYESLIRMLHEHDIMVNASLAFGFDHDTPEIFPDTLDWLVRNKVETMTGHILTPYPGTLLYKRLETEGRIIDYDLSKYNTSNVVFKPKLMTPEELRNGYLQIYEDFYSLRNIVKRRPDSKKLLAPFFMFNFVYRKYGKYISLLGKMGLMSSIGRIGRKIAYGIE